MYLNDLLEEFEKLSHSEAGHKVHEKSLWKMVLFQSSEIEYLMCTQKMFFLKAHLPLLPQQQEDLSMVGHHGKIKTETLSMKI